MQWKAEVDDVGGWGSLWSNVSRKEILIGTQLKGSASGGLKFMSRNR